MPGLPFTLSLQFSFCICTLPAFYIFSLQFAASVCMNLPLVHSLNFAVCRQHNKLTTTMKHNCTQCIQYHAHVQCNVITYDFYIINIFIPRAQVGSESIAIDSEAMRAKGVIVLVKSN